MKTTPLSAAEGFLRRHLRSGQYGLSCHGSDGTTRFPHDKGHVFVGHFLAHALHDRWDESERAVLVDRIVAERQDGLWGYSLPAANVEPEHAPFIVDADDTAFVLLTLRALGLHHSVEPLLAFRSTGGFATFQAPKDAVRLVTKVSPENNRALHIEVNANVFRALQGSDLAHHIDHGLLVAAQADGGHWPSYFYTSPYWAMHQILDLWRDGSGDRQAHTRALRFLAGTQNRDGSWGDSGDPIDTALAMLAVSAAGQLTDRLQRGAHYLDDTMGADGSWSSERAIWRFASTDEDVWTARDHHCVLTTALAVWALRIAAGDR